MKSLDKSKPLPDERRSESYLWIANQWLLIGMPQERFEHWGCLLYSQKISGAIVRQLVTSHAISEN